MAPRPGSQCTTRGSGRTDGRIRSRNGWAFREVGVKMELTIPLEEDRELGITVLTYPIPIQEQVTLIQLWQTEWNKTDFDWLASMKGDYSKELTIRSAVGRVDGQAAGTASVSFSAQDPEVAVVGSVLTHPDFRRLGIATHLTNLVVNVAFEAGCKVCFLGATRDPKSVYLRCGFHWWNGGVMRRVAEMGSDVESYLFAANQRVSVRDANWGDLPGVSCLAIQPLESRVIDYPRGLLSGKYVDLQRCVSNFPVVWYEVTGRGGSMSMLVGEAAHRILGFGTLTPGPGPGQSHQAIIDVITHDNYTQEADRILRDLFRKAARLPIQSVQSYVAASDDRKRGLLERFGMRALATLPDQLKIRDHLEDVVLLEGNIGLTLERAE